MDDVLEYIAEQYHITECPECGIVDMYATKTVKQIKNEYGVFNAKYYHCPICNTLLTVTVAPK